MVFAYEATTFRTESHTPPRNLAVIANRCADAAFACQTELGSAAIQRKRVHTLRENLRRNDLLSHPQRPKASADYSTYLARYQGALLMAVEAVYAGNLAWMDMESCERSGANPDALDVASLWKTEATCPHIFAAFFAPENPLVVSALGEGFVIEEEIGFIDGLDHCHPSVYPLGVRAAIEQGHLQGQMCRTDDGERRYVASQQAYAVPGCFDIPEEGGEWWQ